MRRAVLVVAAVALAARSLDAQVHRRTQAGSASLPVAAPEEVGLSARKLGELSTFLAGFSERGELSGTVAIVVRHGRTVYEEAFGWADVLSRTPMESTSIMRIYSMTKPITCTAAMILVDEGRLLLTDPVAKYLPQFADPMVVVADHEDALSTAPAERPITIRMLASHTAGIGYTPSPDHYPTLARRYEEADIFDVRQSLEKMADNLAGLPLLHQPGTTWQYGASVDVLARVVEVVSGQSFGTFLRERIFEPLGMGDTGFTVPEGDWPRVATLYTRDESGHLVPAPEDPNLDHNDYKTRRHEAGGHGLLSTARDYARFAQMLLNDGALGEARILSPRAAALMRMDVLRGVEHVVETRSFNGPALGFGLCGSVVKTPALHNAMASVGTYSWNGRAATYFFIDPEVDLAAIVMSQHVPNDPYQLFERFTNLVYGAIMN